MKVLFGALGTGIGTTLVLFKIFGKPVNTDPGNSQVHP